MDRRENRITDSSLIGNLMTSLSFYANTTIYIIAGLIPVAGTLDKLMSITGDLPFARIQTKELVEAKVFLPRSSSLRTSSSLGHCGSSTYCRS
jgi:uncharacterized membrane protein